MDVDDVVEQAKNAKGALETGSKQLEAAKEALKSAKSTLNVGDDESVPESEGTELTTFSNKSKPSSGPSAPEEDMPPKSSKSPSKLFEDGDPFADPPSYKVVNTYKFIIR